MQNIEPYGLYIISDQYFSDFPNDRYMENKGEARPHFYCIELLNRICSKIEYSDH